MLVTGWNEWIAGRFAEADGRLAFVDQFDEEFSRDIEPMQGGHADNYYYQLVANVRKHKGSPPLPRASAPATIDIAGSFEPSRDVRPEFVDHRAETLPRDHDGVGGRHYENRSGRNDLALMKVARDENSVYFYARAREPLCPPDDRWMWLLIDTDQNRATGWQGYDLRIRRDPASGRGVIERCVGGVWEWAREAEASLRFEGAELHLAIPRSLFAAGAKAGKQPSPLSFDFKWVDSPQEPGNVLDFYLSGDTAPEGRFNYRFSE